MACSNSCNDNHTVNSCPNERNSGSSFVFIIVLYILLAIIIGSFIIILKRKRRKEVMGRNKNNVLKLPNKAPTIIL